MAETTADVRRDIELTRERMSSTLPSSNKSSTSRKSCATIRGRRSRSPSAPACCSAGRAPTQSGGRHGGGDEGASSKIGAALDDVVASLVGGVHQALDHRVTAGSTSSRAPSARRQRSRGRRLPERTD